MASEREEIGESSPAKIAGPMTLAEAPARREALLAALDGVRGDRLDLDLSAAGPWDLAGLQLVLATLASGPRRGVAVRLVGVPEALRALASRAGLLGSIEGAAGPAA